MNRERDEREKYSREREGWTREKCGREREIDKAMGQDRKKKIERGERERERKGEG